MNCKSSLSRSAAACLAAMLFANFGFGAGAEPVPVAKNFFPFGLYTAGYNDAANLERIRRAGVDLMIDYQWGDYGAGPAQVHPEALLYLDRLRAAELKVLWGLAWYLERPNSWTCTVCGPDLDCSCGRLSCDQCLTPCPPDKQCPQRCLKPRVDCDPPDQAKLTEQTANYMKLFRFRCALLQADCGIFGYYIADEPNLSGPNPK